MIGIDTNVLVRFFVQDDPAQGAVARRFILTDLTPANPGHVSLVALAEMAWVLRSRYRVPREEVMSAIEALLVAANVRVQDADAVWLALDEIQQTRADVSDALISAVDCLHGCSHTVTFDDRATRIPAMRLLS